MGAYFIKGKGWKFQFRINKVRYQSGAFKTKKEALEAERKKREQLKNPQPSSPKTGISFFDLIQRRLDYVRVYHTKAYYDAYRFMARRWARQWKDIPCDEITRGMVEDFLLERAKVSSNAANKDLRYLKAVFGWGIEMGWLQNNPCARLKRMPEAEKRKYIPSLEDVWKVTLAADPEVQDYLWCIICTLGRMGEINQLTWDDVNFDERYVVLYTRKKKGGDRRGRKIKMADRLYQILSRRYRDRDKEKSWVFWQRWWDNKTGEIKEGVFINRSKIMKTLCKKAGVKYFRFHALRHFGASLLTNEGVPLSKTQGILGHEKVTTTAIYIKGITGPESDAIDTLEKAINEEKNGKKKNEEKE